jgi:tRNA(Ile)-lysidine synthase
VSRQLETIDAAVSSWLPRLVAIDDVPSDARVVVGCSGGADSLALLALACAFRFDVIAVYVDHGLQTTTAHDASTVEAAAHRFGARFEYVRVDLTGGSNLEARARDLRYAALEGVRSDVAADAIFIGHTRDDQAETVLLNLFRGSGVAGLAGASPRRGVIRRPLLGLRRADTLEICGRLQLAPVSDPMNEELHFRRVWLRRTVIPFLERGANRDLVEVLARQADLLRDDSELLDSFAAAHDPTDAAALAAMPLPVARRVVRNWLGVPPPALATIDRVLSVARGEQRAIELPGGARVELDHGRLRRVEPASSPSTERIDSLDPTPTPTPASLPLPGSARFGDFELTAWIEHAPPTAWPDGRLVAVCDADRVAADRAIVRVAAPSERFRPLGSGGSKLVRDALAEVGVPAQSRKVSPVVATEAVLWVVGYRIDDRVRVSSSTRQFLWLSASPHRAISTATR